MRKMIFHIPMEIDRNLHSGSQIRPIKMIKAFKNIGYDVNIVMGYVKERREQIKQIKENIKNGVKYEFLYSESSTMPIALTEKHHLPIAPFLDFNFFKFCKKNDIKIGLFYRDIHWSFEQYIKNVSFIKRKFAGFFYKYDLKQYKKYLDIFYLPSKQMYDYIPFEFNKKIIALPPAGEKKAFTSSKKTNYLTFIYVGGLGKLYDLKLFSKVINDIKKINFNLCTRENEWDKNRVNYKRWDKNIKINHKHGVDLDNIYLKSDIAILFVKPTKYWKFVMAVKLFEYISYKKPIIAVKNTAVGDFIEANNIGWVINYNEKELKELIFDLQKNSYKIKEKIKNIEKIIPKNTWEARASQIEKELK